MRIPALFTGRYSLPVKILKPDQRVLLGMTLGRPRWTLPYHLDGNVRELAPSPAWFHSPAETFRRHYRDQLADLGVDGIRHVIADHIPAGKEGWPVVLMCYERLDTKDPGTFCHRQILRTWYGQQTGQHVIELDVPDAYDDLLTPQQLPLAWE